MSDKKRYWKSFNERDGKKLKVAHEASASKHRNEILDLLDSKTVNMKSGRRDFMKLLGFSVTSAAVVASCKRPVRKAIPYLDQPEQVVPGKAFHYATSYFDGEEYAGILVKSRDGRPIKIEANTLSPLTPHGTNARMQASVLSLYDDARLKQPLLEGKETSWDEIDRTVRASLEGEGEAVFLTSTVISPAFLKLLGEFSSKHPRLEIVYYDVASHSAMLEANRITYGKRGIPVYDFSKADLVVGVQCDFLGSWLSPTIYTHQYSGRRYVAEGQTAMNRHIQIESGLSVTGSNADLRMQIKPSEEQLVLANLYNQIASKLGRPVYSVPDSPLDTEKLAEELIRNQGRSLVVSGTNQLSIQLLVNAINEMLGNYGQTLDLSRTLNTRRADDRAMERLVNRMKEGGVQTLFIHGVNPAYDYHDTDAFREGMKQVPMTVGMHTAPNETTSLCKALAPVHHYLESWGDAEAVSDHFSLQQPLIQPLFNTRQAEVSLLRWMDLQEEYDVYLKKYWIESHFNGQSSIHDPDRFYKLCLQKGVYSKRTNRGAPIFQGVDLQAIMDRTGVMTGEKVIELQLYINEGVGSGKYANNPWLMELPDAITKVAWDNYAAVSPRLAEEKGWQQGDIIYINDRFDLPVLIQPGQTYNTISAALGYGRKDTGKVADGTGTNLYPLSRMVDGHRVYYSAPVNISHTDKKHEPALTQEHFHMEGREIVRETNLDDYKKNSYSGNEKHLEVEKHHTTLYDKPEFDGFHWGMAIDLNKCTGCNACVIACQAENNVAVVGKQEVKRRRIMHWIRIDRYYEGDSDHPATVHQPVMCQHCDNAPCENVCPVSATNHSNEGINQMSYNRCIGTKYCINNCPYRVRRFNWFGYVNNKEFDYHQNSQLGKMVLNPDVTVRERGVVEKCSFCVQRIQQAKQDAKLENRQIRDGEIKTACEQACPADALVFGNLNDPESRVSQLFKQQRKYHLLEELHTLPSVGYLTKVRNREQGES